MDRKGLLNEGQELFVTDVMFHRVKWPAWMPKWFTKPILLRVVRMVDNLVLNRIKPELKVILIPFINAAMAGKIEEMRRLATDLGASQLDIKHLSKDTELAMVDSWSRVIVSHSFAYVEYRQNKAWAENQA